MKLRWIKFTLSIRQKIVALIAGALTVSLFSYLYVGTSLVIDDKVSYIYDYNLSQLKAVSDAVDYRIQKVLAMARITGNLIGPETLRSETAAAKVKSSYEQNSKALGINGIVFLRPIDRSHFRIEFGLGEGAKEVQTALDQLGWTPEIYDQVGEFLVGHVINGKLPVGSRTLDVEGRPVAFLTLMTLDGKLLDSGGKDAQTELIDQFGSKILGAAQVDPQPASELAQKLLRGKFSSGVLDWDSPSGSFIVSYQKLAEGKLLLVSYVSRSVAFRAAKALVNRSLVLGISILLIALGLTLVFVKGITTRLRQLWAATQRVIEGDFTCRVDTEHGSGDELGGLAISFNKMSEKIGELMAQTAVKARMEKELETAQEVQSRFFPHQNLADPSFELAGTFISATECGGDWWNYAIVGRHLLVVVGDVTGHGVSAALVTAAVHGAFSLLVKQYQQEDRPVDLHRLLEHLNEAVLAAGQGTAMMTFFASWIDLNTGVMTMANASHTTPYVYRAPKAGEVVPNTAERGQFESFMPLMLGSHGNPLGFQKDVDVHSAHFQLHPGDVLFWYTDGLFENRESDGRKLSRVTLLKTLASISAGGAADPDRIAREILEHAVQFIGQEKNALPDDITVVVGTVPALAVFEEVELPLSRPHAA